MPCAGCAASREWFAETAVDNVVDCCFDAVFGSSTNHVDDDEAHMLKRKGIEPGSERHPSMKAEEELEEELFEEMHRGAQCTPFFTSALLWPAHMQPGDLL